MASTSYEWKDKNIFYNIFYKSVRRTAFSIFTKNVLKNIWIIVALFSSVIKLKPMATGNKHLSYMEYGMCYTTFNFISLFRCCWGNFFCFAYIFSLYASESFCKIFDAQIWNHLFRSLSQGFLFDDNGEDIELFELTVIIIFTLIQNGNSS